jgi:hypothetical protein
MGPIQGRRPTIGQAGGLWKNASDWVKKGVDVRVKGRIYVRFHDFSDLIQERSMRVDIAKRPSIILA